MASFLQLILILPIFFFTCPSINAGKTSRPQGLFLRVIKHPSSLQYITHIRQRTPLVNLPLTVDLGGQHLWVDCEKGYVSSSYRPAHCRSLQCKLVRSKACGDCYAGPKPGCNNNTCSLIVDNTITNTGTDGELSSDVLSLQSTNGRRYVSIKKFLFTCAPNFILKGLPTGVKGVVGLGRTNIALPSQLSRAFTLPQKFTLCLSSSSKHPGIIVIGGGPYYLKSFGPNLIYTPLIINPVSTASSYFQGEPSTEYFIGVRSIKVAGQAIPVNASLLSISKKGYGGTKFSSVTPYTIMETSIYKGVTEAFSKALGPRVAPITPFNVCFNSKSFGFTSTGPRVPIIELVLQGKGGPVWSIIGANSMVKVKDEVWCLGLIDGGVNPRTSIVIGGYQMENILFEFDMQKSRLGFTSSHRFQQTTCSNFSSNLSG